MAIFGDLFSTKETAKNAVRAVAEEVKSEIGISNKPKQENPELVKKSSQDLYGGREAARGIANIDQMSEADSAYREQQYKRLTGKDMITDEPNPFQKKMAMEHHVDAGYLGVSQPQHEPKPSEKDEEPMRTAHDRTNPADLESEPVMPGSKGKKFGRSRMLPKMKKTMDKKIIQRAQSKAETGRNQGLG